MLLLENHLEQISSSAQAIAELDFPPPKIFTNALLGTHEITSLIRDTEPHERALFSLDPSVMRGSSGKVDQTQGSVYGAERSIHTRKSIYATGPPVQQKSAVARVLGPDMLYEIRQTSGSAARGKGAVNIEVLLRGAEKLCEVYHVEGAAEKIASIRQRHELLVSSVSEYQDLITQQQTDLEQFDSATGQDFHDDEVDDATVAPFRGPSTASGEFDPEAEEAEIRELEARKQALEERVTGMGKDLEGLLR